LLKKAGEVVGWQWSRDVKVPLRACDYEVPIIGRERPFDPASREDELALPLAAGLLLRVPFWRRFRQWPMAEANGVSGHRAGADAYAELWAALARYGYEPEIFKMATLPEIDQMLSSGASRETTRKFLAQQAEAGKGDGESSGTVAEVTEEGHTQPGYEVPWTDKRPDGWIVNSDAVELANKCGIDCELPDLSGLDVRGLNKLLRRRGVGVRFMSKRTGKPAGRVHKADWQNYLRRERDQVDATQRAVEKRARELLD